LPRSKLVIREYNKADFPSVLKLYEHSPATPHFVRDEGFISYFIDRYASEGNVFIAVEDEKIVGIATTSITTEEDLGQGNITELKAQDIKVLRALVQAAVDYCTKRDVDIILATPPFDSSEAFDDWLELQTGVMTARIEAPLPFLKTLLDAPQIRNSFTGKKITFQIDKEIIKVKITPETIETTQRDTLDKTAINVALSSKTLLEIACGRLSPMKALLTLKLRSWHPMSIGTVLRLLKMAGLPQQWFIPLADRL